MRCKQTIKRSIWKIEALTKATACQSSKLIDSTACQRPQRHFLSAHMNYTTIVPPIDDVEVGEKHQPWFGINIMLEFNKMVFVCIILPFKSLAS